MHNNYLSNIGYPDIYENVIYPGMKECITAAMIAHRDKIDKRKNCFELYGADFMLTESFQPWLLEINSNPALHASTPVTSRMCPDVLEDVIKVVVDNARNNRADTGNFELVYKDKLEYQKVNAKAQFEITGSPVTEDYFCDVAAKTSSHSERNSFKQLDPSKAPFIKKHLNKQCRSFGVRQSFDLAQPEVQWYCSTATRCCGRAIAARLNHPPSSRPRDLVSVGRVPTIRRGSHLTIETISTRGNNEDGDEYHHLRWVPIRSGGFGGSSFW
ncbi:uncharacterized protein LOC115880069 [Sitophilus oryzae]|uniref:Uncharacterized protein LOC115880069 n=1 Tax=Sitophilus oryzae TaxID=7048 RepID=A0A6J2XNF6_SITOR|nr:uncharacterized protein LOC115880069 [Sitophilus oryzae]